jgi:cytochrome P450
MVDLMSLEEQVDREFTAARRRARIRGLRAKLRKQSGTGTLLSFEEQRRSRRAYGGVRRGRDTVELSRIVGCAGKHDWFDEGFMPLRALSREHWKHIVRAFRLGHELPPVILYQLGGLYFVADGHHRVSVARFHGAEWIDAEVTEYGLPHDNVNTPGREPGGCREGARLAKPCGPISGDEVAHMSEIAAPDLASSRFKANPHPFYAWLREEAPVWRTTLPDKRTAWLVTRYDDVAGVLKYDGFVKDPWSAQDPAQRAEGPWVPGFLKPLEQNMLDLDDPDHRRLRTLVAKAFTPRIIEGLRGRVEAICQELLDAMEHEGRADLVRDYALPLPATVIAELLGVPAGDHRKFHRWSNRIVSVSSGRDVWRAMPAAVAFVRYLRKMSDRRRASPEDDLISALVQAEEAGDKLSQDELLAMSFLLLVAGHETTVNLIASGTLALIEHPEQLERLKADLQLIKPAVEELLRYTSPVEIATERYARQDLEVSGIHVPRGELVLAVLGSANRDERHFEDPDSLDLARDPNKHLAFGRGGIHHCLGAPLARMEGQIAITALLQRFPGIDLAVTSESLRWRRGLFLRGLERLPVELGSRS